MLLPFIIGDGFVLLLLGDEVISQNENVHIRHQETSQSVFRRTNNWLTANVKTRIDENRTPGNLIKVGHELMQ